MPKHVGAVRDVIYDLSSDESDWMEDLSKAFASLMPDASMLSIASLRLHSKGASLDKVAPDSMALRLFLKVAVEGIPASQIHYIIRSAPSIGAFTEWVKPMGVPNFWKGLSSAGLKMTDFMGVRALDGGDRFLSVSAWYDSEQRTSETQRRVLEPVAAHVATMFRLRRSLLGRQLLPEHGDAVFEVDGRVVHTEGETTPKDTRALLREQVAQIEAAKTQAGKREGQLWKPLVDGRWTLIDRYDTDGRRLYVAIKNAPTFAPDFALSTREQQVARMAAQGLANKEIAYALGLSLSSIDRHIPAPRPRQTPPEDSRRASTHIRAERV